MMHRDLARQFVFLWVVILLALVCASIARRARNVGRRSPASRPAVELTQVLLGKTDVHPAAVFLCAREAMLLWGAKLVFNSLCLCILGHTRRAARISRRSAR